MKKKQLTVVMAPALAVALGSAASAGEILWDQPPIPDKPAFKDQNYGDFPDFAIFLVADVVFDTGVKISSITTYFTNGNGAWPQNASGFATLNIFLAPLSNADHHPQLGQSVAVDFVTTANGIEVTASGLNINLDAGTYWVGLTPELDFLVWGQEFHQRAASMGAATQARNPGGGFGLGTDWFDAGMTFNGIPDWDGAIRIEGIPAPGAMALLGLAGFFGGRRRRRS